LSGVDGWQGTNGQGGKTALPDWTDIALNGRRVYIAFDSDAATKPSVAGALERLGYYLARKADVRYCYLPDGPNGTKVGLDDYLAAGGSIDALIERSTPTLVAVIEAELPTPRTADESATSATAATGYGVDGAALLDEVHDFYTRYVIFPSLETADAITLYTAATHAQSAWEHASRLVIKSPIKRCGKTRAQEVARELVHKALPTTNISPAALARSISNDDPPTLILDEADTVWGKKEHRSEGAEDLRGILNAGHSRGWPYVRWDAQARKSEECPTFAMAIIGGIDDMPDTIEDRAVIISMRRRAPGEFVTQWRTRRAVPALKELRSRLHAWVMAQSDALAVAEPDLPAEDRAADVWEPLVAIADAAGGDWPDRARKACQVIAGTADDPRDGTAGERLLANLKSNFDGETFLYSATIARRLAAIEEAPWSEWRRVGIGREPINGRGLADLLRPWGIRPRNGREGGTGSVGKGYYAEDLADAWSRYSGNTATDDESAQVNHVADAVADSGPSSATDAHQSELPDVADVADSRLDGARRGWLHRPRRGPGSMTATSDIERAIGAKVRQLRVARHWSQAHLARKLAEAGWPLHQTNVSNMEAGSRPIRVADVYAVAEVLGVPAASIFFAIEPGGETSAAAGRLMARRDAEEAVRTAGTEYAMALAERDRLALAAGHSAGGDQ